eukprot:m.8311 g.8311  ORF g.8311 m.8311 type:complete len:378 (+) comp5202_c0_seq1:207-1340(+)
MSECLVCCQGFSSSPATRLPKSLPCGHTLCLQCAGALIVRGHVCCPTCRATTALRTAADLPTNYSLLHVVEVGADMPPASPEKPAGKAAPAISRFAIVPPPRPIARHGSDANHVQRPRGMCIGPDSSVLVCDKEQKQLMQVYTDGRAPRPLPQTAFQTFFGLVRDKTEPYNIDVDRPSGDYFLVDVGHHRALRLRHGNIVWTFGSQGVGGTHLDSPRDIKLLPDGRVIVADCGNDRLLLLDARTGQSVGTIQPFPALELRCPAGLAVDRDGHIYVSDNANDRVVVMDTEGKVQRILGSRGSAPGQLAGPEGVAVGPDGLVYVADGGNNRIVVFHLDGCTEHIPTPSRPVFLAVRHSPPALIVACDTEVIIFDPLPSV